MLFLSEASNGMNQDSKLVGFSWRAGVSFDDCISLNNSVSSVNIVIFCFVTIFGISLMQNRNNAGPRIDL